MGNLKETHNVFLRFFFPWEKPFGNHKMCLLMGFSGENTTRRQQCITVPVRAWGRQTLCPIGPITEQVWKTMTTWSSLL